MKLTTVTAAAAALFILSQPAQAHEHHARHHAYREARRHAPMVRQFEQPQDQQGGWNTFAAPAPSVYRGEVGARPAAWCGWEMRQLVGSDPGPQFNLARNWSHWGHAGPVGVGAVVVWSHHVGKIVGQDGGQWLIESGNDGHAMRTRVRSIAGAIAIRWG
jgi:hypothetical protein